jgi:hypothetical protein
MTDIPILQAGDQIHIAVPARPDPSMLQAMEEAYADRGITIFRISELSISCIEIISVIRASIPWQYGVRSGDDLHLFDTFEEAANYAEPTDESHPRLPIVRQLRGEWQVAMP